MENIETIREHILQLVGEIGKIKHITSFNIGKSLETQRGVVKLLDKVKNIIFDGKENDEFKKNTRKITSSYYNMKDKFAEKLRDDGTRYFEHLRGVAYLTLELPNPSVDKVLIAIFHDAMEDIGASFEDIVYMTDSEKIALAVEAMTKKPWQDYDQDESKGKKLRNQEYFGHLKSYENMNKYVRELAKSKNIELSEIEIGEIAMNVFDVKFADRIHNLSTQWDENNIKKVERKINETSNYFLDIAEQINPQAYELMLKYINELEEKLNLHYD